MGSSYSSGGAESSEPEIDQKYVFHTWKTHLKLSGIDSSSLKTKSCFASSAPSVETRAPDLSPKGRFFGSHTSAEGAS